MSPQEAMREAHVPAQQSQAEQDARFPHSDENARWPSGPEGAARSRPQAAVGLKQPVRDRGTFEALARARPARRGAVSVRCVEDGNGPARVSYAVGRRVGNAVVRNRARRRLRSAVERYGAELAPGHAYLVSAGRAVVTMQFEVLAATVGELVRAAGDRSR